MEVVPLNPEPATFESMQPKVERAVSEIEQDAGSIPGNS